MGAIHIVLDSYFPDKVADKFEVYAPNNSGYAFAYGKYIHEYRSLYNRQSDGNPSIVEFSVNDLTEIFPPIIVSSPEE